MVNLYGLVLTFAVFISYSLTAYRAKKMGLSTQIVWDSLPWVLGFGILGARIYHVVNYWNYYSQNLMLIPQVWLGGLGIWGALVGGLLGIVLYFKFQITNNKSQTNNKTQNSNYRLLVTNYLEAAAPAIVLGQAVGRVGNLFNMENMPYAYWEIIIDLVILLFLLYYEWFSMHRKSRGNVSMFKLYLLLYCLGRFVLEIFRTDSPWIFGPLTVAQWVCLVVAISTMVFYPPFDNREQTV